MFMKNLEKKFGLPPLKDSMQVMSEAMKMAQSPTMKKLEKLLANMEKFSQGAASIQEIVTLLELVGKLDKDGTLDKLMEMLKLLKPLSTSKGAKALMDNLQKLVQDEG